MKAVYYLEVLSSWCHWAEPTWQRLQKDYKGRVEFEWRIALMGPGDFPVSRNQCEWFYRRSGGTVMHSPVMLNPGWLEPKRKGVYTAPNLVAEAAKDFGFTDDRVRHAITHAAVIEGRRVGDIAIAVAAASKASGIPAKKLRARAESDAVKKRVAASTAEFHAHQINQRPAFVLTSRIGDKAVFSGVVAYAPLAATLDAMLHDQAAYAAHAAHHGSVPPS
jgi:predicted DsbA family dithiol-disulfide isomerase